MVCISSNRDTSKLPNAKLQLYYAHFFLHNSEQFLKLKDLTILPLALCFYILILSRRICFVMFFVVNFGRQLVLRFMRVNQIMN